MSSLLKSLNKRQQQAVCHQNGGLLVLAGAGTGKTRVLTSRVAWLISQCNCPPNSILAVTFTNKAAKEMQERVFAMLTGYAAPTVGTFHGICHRMIRRHAAVVGWDKNFQILDAQDQKTFIRRLLIDNNISTDEYPPTDCRYYINRTKERGQRPANAPGGGRDTQLREIYDLYETACRRENKMDFAELLLSAIDLLRADQSLRQHYAARFRHILIDEFQDTNPLQYEWLRLLDGGDNVFFAVGDDDQSIYAFRGADPDNMRKIGRDLRATNIIRLEENYRSTGNILQTANVLIAANKKRLGKNLFTSQKDGAPIDIIAAATDIAEAENITDGIRDNIADNIAAADIAVLYRTNAQSRLLEKSLIQHRMPYRIYGGMRFFERQEIKHALAYMRLAAADDADALLRVINIPPRGIGRQTIAALTADGAPFAAIEKSGLPKVAVFRALLHKLRQQRAAAASLADMAQTAIEDSGLLQHYETHKEETERVENLREFVSAARQFQPDNDDEELLLAFLANAALESGEAQNGDKNIGDAVNLMTVHAAKGLEFAAVHIAGLEEGMFPSAQSLDADNSATAIEEERRLMYVAITRARRRLFLHFASSRMVYGSVKIRPPSRFLHELPPTTVRYETAPPPPSSAFVAPPSVKYRPPRATTSSPHDNSPYRPGDTVRHAKYGVGVVIRREGSGDELKVEVAFKQIGSKVFLANIAPLQRL